MDITIHSMPVNIFITYKNWFLLLLLLAFASLLAHAQIPDSAFPMKPYPERLVNDFTATLSTAETQWLEDKLVNFDKESSNQISIIMMNTIGDYDIADYATGLGRFWGIGQHGKNNGVLILLVMQSHDINISPGYGLEGALPDVLCKQIIENEMVPSFKSGYYYEGLDKATTVIIAATKGEYTNSSPYKTQKKGMPRWLIITLLIVGINGFFFVVIPLLTKLYYYIIGKEPPKRRPSEWTYSTTDTMEKKETSYNSSGSSSDGFGGYGGGSFGGAGASGKW